MTDIRLYGHYLPNEKDLVNFIFTSRDKDILNCYLVDYNLPAVMPHRFATLKKKVKGWNKIAPLNKPLVGTVEEVGTDNPPTIIISIAYINKEDSDYIDFTKKTNNNNSLLSIFKKWSFSNGKNSDSFLKELWEKTIHPLDNIRTQSSDLSLYDFINQNRNLINCDSDLYNFIITSLDEYNREKNSKIISDIGIVSVGGIENTIELINETINETQLDINVLVDSVPNYKVVSDSVNINKANHSHFISILKEKSQKYNPPIYIKVS